jgi:hypothetical protein
MDLDGVELDDLQPRRPGSRWLRVVGLALVLMGLMAGAYVLLRSAGDEEPAATPPLERARPGVPVAPTVQEPAGAETAGEPAVVQPSASSAGAPASGVAPAAEPEIRLPALDESDSTLQALAHRVSTHPWLPAWLATKGLVRRFVVVVDNIAEGASPRRHLVFLAPEAAFKVSRRKAVGSRERSQERVFIDASSYERYNLIADVFASLDAKSLAEIYRTMKPLVEEAYRELGVPENDFDERLSRAFEVLLETPIVEGEIELELLVTTYAYADPELEDLMPAQKQFLRMGPRNVALIQAKLREVAVELARVYLR